MESDSSLNLCDRLEKDARGSLITILILGIINANENTWGYQIKQKLQEVFGSGYQIRDSTLYTTLRNLENNYGLVTSEFKERRRTYRISSQGEGELSKIYAYWVQLMIDSVKSFGKVGLPLPTEISEVL